MKAKKAWFDNNHEGKLLRYGINKLAKKLKTSDDTDELIKILNCLSLASNSKANLGKFEIVDKKLNTLLTLLKEQQPKRFIADNYSGELPRPEDSGTGTTTSPAEETNPENTG